MLFCRSDYVALRKFVCQYPLRGYMISVQRIKVSLKLKVKGFNDKMTNQCIENHFAAMLIDKRAADPVGEDVQQLLLTPPEVIRTQADCAVIKFQCRDG